eukprot:COSAG01_NODE_51325_length_355_cov_2.011719_2_plen_23_part_01
MACRAAQEAELQALAARLASFEA